MLELKRFGKQRLGRKLCLVVLLYALAYVSLLCLNNAVHENCHGNTDRDFYCTEIQP